MLAALTRAVERRHPWTSGHASRVAELAVAVAVALEWADEQVECVRLGSLLHDVGKLTLETELLGKPGPLTPLERARLRTHPAEGARLLDGIETARTALPCVLFHHERWDGAGYPVRLATHEIPAVARLVGLADAFDAMRSPRPYRPALADEEALAELARCAGSQFDPMLAAVCVETWQTSVRLAV